MAKMTVLEMTQNILAAMDSDNVNSIDDTQEATDVAEFIKEAYFSILSESDDWPFLRTLSALDGLGDTDNPTKMEIPEDVNKIKWVKYNKKDVTYIKPKDFKDMLDLRVQSDNVDENGFATNQDPVYWTTYDDHYVIFDGYNSDVESTLTTGNSTIYCAVAPAWTHDNEYTPNLPEKFFPFLLAEAKASCFLNIKQQGNNREERKANRGRNVMATHARKEENGDTKTNKNIDYGRK